MTRRVESIECLHLADCDANGARSAYMVTMSDGGSSVAEAWRCTSTWHMVVDVREWPSGSFAGDPIIEEAVRSEHARTREQQKIVEWRTRIEKLIKGSRVKEVSE